MESGKYIVRVEVKKELRIDVASASSEAEAIAKAMGEFDELNCASFVTAHATKQL